MVVHLSSGKFVAFDAICTHVGCPVALAVMLVAVRFFTAGGLRGNSALLYLLATLALLASVSLTGYYGGEMTYHHAVGAIGAARANASTAASDAAARLLLPACAPRLPRACHALFKLRSLYSGAWAEKHTPAAEIISL